MRHLTIVVVLFLLSSTPSNSAAAPEFVGEWESNDAPELKVWSDGACRALVYETNNYRVSKVAGSGELSITLLAVDQVRYIRNVGGTCLYDGQTQPGLVVMRGRIWQGGAEPTPQNGLSVQLEYVNCVVSDCSSLPTPPAKIIATLERHGPTLQASTSPPGPSDGLYRLRSDLPPLQAEAERSFHDLLDKLQQLPPEQFVASYGPLPQAEAPAQAVEETAVMRRLSEKVVSRSVVEFRKFDQVRGPGGPRPVDGVLLLNEALVEGGGKVLEVALMLHTPGGWHLIGYFL